MRIYLKEIGTSNDTTYDVCMDKNYFLIGRRADNDLVIDIDKVSRFNGIIAKHPVKNSLYLLSISRNKNLFHNAHTRKFDAKSSLVPNSIDSLMVINLANSTDDLAAIDDTKADAIVSRKNLPNMSSFQPGTFRKLEHIKPLLKKLKKTEYFDFCIKESGIKLENGCFIAVKTRSVELVYQLVIEVQYMKMDKPDLTFDNLLLSEDK